MVYLPLPCLITLVRTLLIYIIKHMSSIDSIFENKHYFECVCVCVQI